MCLTFEFKKLTLGIIAFHEIEVKSALQDRKLFKAFLLNIFKGENIALNRIDIIFCSDEYLLDLNKYHLGHYYYTDTLSFLLSQKGEPVIGEIYISTQRVKVNSLRFSAPYQKELKRVIIHGCLHLCDYKDKPKVEFIKMEKIQEEYLRMWVASYKNTLH